MNRLKLNHLLLKKSKEDFNLFSYTGKHFVFIFRFIKYLNFLFSNKNVWIFSNIINFVSNKLYITLNLFYRTSKITYYRKKGYAKKISLKKSNKFLFLFFSFFSKFRNNFFNFNIRILNKEIDKNSVSLLFKKMKRFSGMLFNRRFGLFIDFLKITSLFCNNKINVKNFLFLIMQIFKGIPKQNHTKFLVFLSFLFKLIIKNFPLIKGLKFKIYGRLRGKPRASFSCIQEGTMPIQSFDKDITFAQIHAYTVIGAFGLRLWVFKQ